MANFAGFISKIGSVFTSPKAQGIEKGIVSIADMVVPALPPPVGTVGLVLLNLIHGIEIKNEGKSGNGAAKKDYVLFAATAMLPIVFQMQGKVMPPGLVDNLPGDIDAIVRLINRAKELEETLSGQPAAGSLN